MKFHFTRARVLLALALVDIVLMPTLASLPAVAANTNNTVSTTQELPAYVTTAIAWSSYTDEVSGQITMRFADCEQNKTLITLVVTPKLARQIGLDSVGIIVWRPREGHPTTLPELLYFLPTGDYPGTCPGGTGWDA